MKHPTYLTLCLAFFLFSCSNPLTPSSSLPPGFHPGIPGPSASPGEAPTITEVIPSSGPSTGGTLLTINGTGFVAGVSVLLGGQSCNSVVVISSTQLTCLTPAHATGADTLIVTDPGQLVASLSNAFFFTGGGSTSPVFAVAAGGGFSSGGGMNLRGTIGTMSGSSVLQSGGNVKAYTGIQSVFTKP
jgi:hypothetical protein